MDIIKIKNLNFSYGNNNILNNINLNIKKGRITGILGPNGCGKSTLLKNILGYLKYSSGDIIINNKSSKDYSQLEKSKVISFVPQKSSLVTAMTVEEFILLGRLPHLKSCWNGYDNEDKKLALHYAKELGVDKFLNRKAPTLSGGEFQKVLLARALTQETQIILLDEPTSALDLNHALDLMEKVKKYVTKNNITAIIVLHDFNLASMFCDDIVMLKNGKVFDNGTPKKVINTQNLKSVYNLNCEIFYTEKNIPYVIPKRQGDDIS